MNSTELEPAVDALKRMYGFEAWGHVDGDANAQDVRGDLAPAGAARMETFSAESTPAAEPEAPARQPIVRGHVPPASLVAGDIKQSELLVELPEQPRCTQAIWRLPAAFGHALMRLDTYEAASRGQARELLLGLMGEVQFPLDRWQHDAPGEVAFASPTSACATFVRGNLVVLVSAIGPGGGPATEIAKLFDAQLMAASPMPQALAAHSDTTARAPGRRVVGRIGDAP
ncbi:MAG: hypothetical protein JWP52_1743 [Rhizobacter sp.]|nr:hypothetical protein [Rhizobacter sp.]